MFKNTQGVFDWSKIATGVLIAIILPLVALVYHTMSDTIKANKTEAKFDCIEIKDVLKDKVDNHTMLQYLEIQKQQTDILKEDLQEQKKTDKELLKAVQNLNINMVIIQQQLKKE